MIYSAVLKERLRGLTEVESESIAQLIGYDADDHEFYDDDILIDLYGAEVLVKDLIINYSDIGSKFELYKLKKE